MCKKVQNNLYLKLLVLLFIISQAPLIGYPSGQDGPILPAWDFPFDPAKKDFKTRRRRVKTKKTLTSFVILF